jgi:hypothetical protein
MIRNVLSASVVGLVITGLAACSSGAPQSSQHLADDSDPQIAWVDVQVTEDDAAVTMSASADDWFDETTIAQDPSDDTGTASAKIRPASGTIHIETPRGNLDNPCSRAAKSACSRGGRLDLTCACAYVADNCSGREQTVAAKYLGCKRSRASHDIRVDVPSSQAQPGHNVFWDGAKWIITGVVVCFASGLCEVVLSPVGI